MARETITVLSVSAKSRKLSERTVWSVKVREDGTKFGVWYGIFTDIKPTKGQVMTLDVETVVGNDGRTFYNAEIVQGAAPVQPAPAAAQSRQPAQSTNGNRATYAHSFGEYAAVARKAHAFALELEPGEAAARARTALVSTFLIAFGNGQLGLDAPKPGDEWGESWENVPKTPAKYEKCLAHDHLNKVIWAYFERIGGNADDAQTMLFEVSGKQDVLELSEKEAIAARLKAEKIIDEKTDYRDLFSIEARKIAEVEGWDFDGEPTMTAEQKKVLNDKKKAILMRAKMKSPAATATQQEWKDAFGELTDDTPF